MAMLLQRIHKSAFFNKRRSVVPLSKYYFTTSPGSEKDQNSQPPPLFEYEAPKDDSYQNFQSNQQFIKRYIILFPVALYCMYQMALIRRNKFSGRKEYKLINMPFEVYVVGSFMSHRIKKKYQNVIYKQDTVETQLVQKCLDRLIDANFLRALLPFISIKVIHDEYTVGLFMSLDQTLFVTIQSLKVAGMDEAKLAQLISHELSHYLLDHQVSRIVSSAS